MKPNDGPFETSRSKKQSQYLLENFSSSVLLPKRIRQSSFFALKAAETSASSHSDDEGKGSLTDANLSAPQDLTKEEALENFTVRKSPKLDAGKSAKSQPNNPSFQKFLFQDSDSLCDRYNLLQSNTNTQQFQWSSKHKLSAEPAQSQTASQMKKQPQETLKQPQYLKSQHTLQNQIFQSEPNQEVPECVLQKLEKYTQKEETSFYSEWHEVFDQKKMTDLYHNYNPVHFDQQDIRLIMSAIQQASSDHICGKVFINRAYRYYLQTYGRLGQGEFEVKVVGDLLFLFRQHNQKQKKYSQQRQQLLREQKKAKKHKTKF